MLGRPHLSKRCMASSRGEFMYIDDEEDSIDRKDHAIMEEEQELF